MNLNFNFTGKRVQIDKANSSVMISIAVASIITAFALVSSKTLLSQAAYQRRVLSAENNAVKQLKSNLDAVNTLHTQYGVFASGDPNILGGNNTGTGPQDGDNPRIVLDALPSSYDFPALTSSLEKIMKGDNIAILSIGGTDLEPSTTNSISGSSASAANGTSTTAPPPTSGGAVQPIAMSFTLSSTGAYGDLQNLIKDFERSVRPFDITSMDIGGNIGALNITLAGNTFYQPPKSVDITQKVIK